MAPAKAAYAATVIFFIQLFRPFRAVVLACCQPWVTPTVIDIQPFQGCCFILASAVGFTHGY
jgi:hypothetical protein